MEAFVHKPPENKWQSLLSMNQKTLDSFEVTRFVFWQDALKQSFKPPDKPWFDFGAGVNLEFDEGQLHPTVRLKVKDFFSVKVGLTSRHLPAGPPCQPQHSWDVLVLVLLPACRGRRWTCANAATISEH